MALTTAERTNITKLVVAMFNAAPGATYLAELTVAYEANGRSLTNLARDLSNTAAYKALNPAFQTAAEFATALLTPLGLQANTTAVDFVVSRFNAGNGNNKGQIALDVATALTATTATEFAAAKAILDNKTAVAEYYSVTKAVAQTNVGSLQQVIASVTNTAASVTAANTAIDAGVGVSGGGTLVFTTGIDNLSGGTGNDTFIGDFGVANQVTSADQVNGGGGVDTLRLFGTYNAANLPTLTSIEVLDIVTAADAAITTAGITGLTTLQVSNAAALNGKTLTLAAGVSANLATTASTATAGAVTLAQAATATASNVTLFGYQAGVAAGARQDLTVTGAAVTTQTITTNTAANTVGVFTAPATTTTLNIAAATAFAANTVTAGAVTKAVVTGAGAVTIAASDFAATVEVDASAATGAVAYTAEAAGSTLTFKGGTGADSVTFAAGTLTSADKLTGGDGADKIVVNALGAAAEIAGINGSTTFEAVGLATTGLTLDISLITNATVKNFATEAGNISATFNNSLSTTEYTINNSAGNTGTVVISNKVGESTTKVTIDAAAATANQTLATLTLSGVTTTNLVSTGTGTGSANTITTVGNQDNAVINITGTKDLTITNALAGTAVGSKVDANAFTGKLTVTGTGFADVIIGGSAADTITTGNGNDTVTGGAGADRIIVTGANQQDNLTGGDGADVFVFSAADLANLGKVSAGTAGVTRITDFTAGTDKITLISGGPFTSITLAAAQTIATAASLTAVYGGITAIAASVGNAAASGVVVTVSAGAAAGTYLYVNDGTGGVAAADDLLINITGITGTLAATDFLFA